MSRINILLHRDYALAEARRARRWPRAAPGVNRRFVSRRRPAAAIVAVLGELAVLALSGVAARLRR